MMILYLHVALIRDFMGANRPTQHSHKKLPGLTNRENEILHWMGSGKTNWKISQILNISENIIKNMFTNPFSFQFTASVIAICIRYLYGIQLVAIYLVLLCRI